MKHGRIHIEVRCSPTPATPPVSLLHLLLVWPPVSFTCRGSCLLPTPAHRMPRSAALLFKSPAPSCTTPSLSHLKGIKPKVNAVFRSPFGAGKYKTRAPGMVYFCKGLLVGANGTYRDTESTDLWQVSLLDEGEPLFPTFKWC